MQTPVTAVPQTWLQQIMPYLVMLSITVITPLIGVVKVYADKLVAQLKVNKSAATMLLLQLKRPLLWRPQALWPLPLTMKQ